MGLSLELLEVKTKHKPNFHRSRKAEVKAPTFPTSPPPPHQQLWPNPLGRVSTCVPKLGRNMLGERGSTAPVVVAHGQGPAGSGTLGFQSW